jgi:hypothetical protein
VEKRVYNQKKYKEYSLNYNGATKLVNNKKDIRKIQQICIVVLDNKKASKREAE